ncbi:MAG: hypothetical protein ACQER9_00845 [Nanobdellota archaeon]
MQFKWFIFVFITVLVCGGVNGSDVEKMISDEGVITTVDLDSDDGGESVKQFDISGTQLAEKIQNTEIGEMQFSGDLDNKFEMSMGGDLNLGDGTYLTVSGEKIIRKTISDKTLLEKNTKTGEFTEITDDGEVNIRENNDGNYETYSMEFAEGEDDYLSGFTENEMGSLKDEAKSYYELQNLAEETGAPIMGGGNIQIKENGNDDARDFQISAESIHGIQIEQNSGEDDGNEEWTITNVDGSTTEIIREDDYSKVVHKNKDETSTKIFDQQGREARIITDGDNKYAIHTDENGITHIDENFYSNNFDFDELSKIDNEDTIDIVFVDGLGGFGGSNKFGYTFEHGSDIYHATEDGYYKLHEEKEGDEVISRDFKKVKDEDKIKNLEKNSNAGKLKEKASNLNEDQIENLKAAKKKAIKEAQEDYKTARRNKYNIGGEDLFGGGLSIGLDYTLNIMNTFSEYEGASALFIGEEELAEKKREYQKQMEGLYLGKVIESAMCDSVQETPLAQGGSVAFVTLPSGTESIGATIQGKISHQTEVINETTGEKKTKFLYKLTYSITNPYADEEPLPEWKYNVYVLGSQNKPIWSGTRKVAGGETETYSKRNMITFYSKEKYDKVCIRFQGSPKGLETDEVCNIIVNEEQSPTPFKVSENTLEENQEQQQQGNSVQLNDDL